MLRRDFMKAIGVGAAGWLYSPDLLAGAGERPNVILLMTDDQGWGETGYCNHPVLKTPNLDAMAENGLRFDRFYAGAPVCSPTRASVLTGRCNERTGVLSHGYALHLQERTIAQAMQKAGYATAHFGKWHLDGLRGAGAPVLASDHYHPGHFGFDEWLSVTNYFDRNPIMGRNGKIEEFKGDSSEIIVAEALKFIERKDSRREPFFVVIWYGSPHNPQIATRKDKKGFAKLSKDAANHYGELVAMDRSIGTLRARLRELGLADNTLLWFNSDNGGLKKYGPKTVGGLRGYKGSIWEGGLRVPGIVEWPNGIQPRITKHPACTMDIMPTLVDLLNLPGESMLDVVDGTSLTNLFKGEDGRREKPIPFFFRNRAVLIDNRFKIVANNVGEKQYLLFDLENDPAETKDIFLEKPEIAGILQAKLEVFIDSVHNSKRGADYPKGRVAKDGPHGRFWFDTPEYKPYLSEWMQRPEYRRYKKRVKGL